MPRLWYSRNVRSWCPRHGIFGQGCDLVADLGDGDRWGGCGHWDEVVSSCEVQRSAWRGGLGVLVQEVVLQDKCLVQRHERFHVGVDRALHVGESDFVGAKQLHATVADVADLLERRWRGTASGPAIRDAAIRPKTRHSANSGCIMWLHFPPQDRHSVRAAFQARDSRKRVACPWWRSARSRGSDVISGSGEKANIGRRLPFVLGCRCVGGPAALSEGDRAMRMLQRPLSPRMRRRLYLLDEASALMQRMTPCRARERVRLARSAVRGCMCAGSGHFNCERAGQRPPILHVFRPAIAAFLDGLPAQCLITRWRPGRSSQLCSVLLVWPFA